MTITEARHLAEAAHRARNAIWRRLRTKNEPTRSELRLYRRTFDAQMVREAQLREAIDRAANVNPTAPHEPFEIYRGDLFAWIFIADAIDAETGPTV